MLASAAKQSSASTVQSNAVPVPELNKCLLPLNRRGVPGQLLHPIQVMHITRHFATPQYLALSRNEYPELITVRQRYKAHSSQKGCALQLPPDAPLPSNRLDHPLAENQW